MLMILTLVVHITILSEFNGLGKHPNNPAYTKISKTKSVSLQNIGNWTLY